MSSIELIEAVPEASKRGRRAWWLTQPSARYVRDPWFYYKYDLIWLAIFAGLSATLLSVGWQGVPLGLDWTLVPLFLGAAYLQMLAGVFVHNCTHENFPRRINRLIGEICGVIVGTRYASWEILHRRHHLYSDDLQKDPHPAEPSFWAFFVRKMLGNLERNLHQQYYELYGETPETRRRELGRTWLSVLVGAALFVAWYVALGPVGFFLVYLPALAVGVLHVSHFNWVTHDARKNDARDYKPINIDDGIYWLANRLLFGLYMHANHHALVKVFNPLKVDPARRARAEAKMARIRNR